MKAVAKAAAGSNAGSQAPAPAPAAQPASPAGAFSRPSLSLDPMPPADGAQPPQPPAGEPGQEPPPAAAPAQPEVEQPQGEPENPDPAVGDPATELMAKNGRKFKDAADLLATYDASSTEAQRLYTSEQSALAQAAAYREQMEQANNALLEMQGQIGAGAFPGLKLPDGTFLQALSSDNDEETRMNFYFEKRKWQDQQESIKQRLANAKTNADAYATRVRESISRNEQRMVADPASFPDYGALKEIREDILKQSPYLGNKEETPYVTYLLALGVKALEEKKAVSKAEAESRAKAAAASAGAAAAAQGAGSLPAGARGAKPKDAGLEGLVKGYHNRTAYK